jgi:hypothetical protein
MTSTTTTSVIIDRLADALAKEGVTLKRHQLLKIAARTLGHRDAHHMNAAHAAGEMSPPRPAMTGFDDHGLAVLHDPVADLPFAMDISAASSRAGRWTVSPYGTLLDVSTLPTSRRQMAPAIDQDPPARLSDIGGILAEHPIVPIPGLRLSGVETQIVDGRRTIRISGRHDGGVEAMDAWCARTGPLLKEVDAHVERRGDVVAIVFDGDAGIEDATMAEDWIAATTDLLTPTEGRERIHARFTPEAWVKDYAMEVDAQGDRRIDVTYEMLMLGFDTASMLESGDADHLQEAVRAPEWIRRWNGPFTITVHDGVTRSTLFPST